MSQPAAVNTAAAARSASAGWTIAAIVMIGLNLRPAVSGIGPILREIEHALGFSSIAAGALNTLPVLCFGLVSPLAPAIARRNGMERTILVCLALLAVATAIRALAGAELLFLGMIAIGFGVGIVNVLLPAIIKQDFPNRIGALTGFYTAAICAGAATSVLLTPPLERALGGNWRWGVGVWAIPAAVAVLVWLPQCRYRRATGGGTGLNLRHRLWRSALAWAVTGYLTAMTSLAYAVFAWGPTLLQDRGLSVDGSSEQMALSFLIQALSGFLVPTWAGRRHDQRAPAIGCTLFALVGLLGWLYAPVNLILPCTILCGIGQGGAFGLALALIGFRSRNAETAGQLSGMAQTVCYIVGGLTGPFAVGLVHQWAGGWNAVGVLFAAVSLAGLATGWAAGRNATVALDQG